MSVVENVDSVDKSLKELFDSASDLLLKSAAGGRSGDMMRSKMVQGKMMALQTNLSNFDKSCDVLLGQLDAYEEKMALARNDLNQDLAHYEACKKSLEQIKITMDNKH
mmetsp:Transcript_3904/g.7193  ORF Transcript_3904/g.7193 Transcript_3904/m.7193 type:complete len:108 (+) Transcript_3904:51-374(+)